MLIVGLLSIIIYYTVISIFYLSFIFLSINIAHINVGMGISSAAARIGSFSASYTIYLVSYSLKKKKVHHSTREEVEMMIDFCPLCFLIFIFST